MAKYERFSVVLETPNMMEIGQSVLLQSGKRGVITKIEKVEFVSLSLVLVSGNSKVV